VSRSHIDGDLASPDENHDLRNRRDGSQHADIEVVSLDRQRIEKSGPYLVSPASAVGEHEQRESPWRGLGSFDQPVSDGDLTGGRVRSWIAGGLP
jgi:hypothetical protein